MANDISKIKTPDGVVHDLKDSRVPANAKFTDTNYYHTTGSWNGLTYTATANGGAGALALTLPTGTTSTTVALGNHTHTDYVPFVGKNSGNAAQFVRYNSLSQRYEGGVSSHFMVTIPATTAWIQFSIELSLHDYNGSRLRYSKLFITGGHNNSSPFTLDRLIATLIGNAGTDVSYLSGISVRGKTDTSGKIYLYIVGDTNYKTLSVDNMLVADGIINTNISDVSISNYTELPSDTIAATMQYNYNPMTMAYDMIVGGTNGAPTRLAKGSNGTFLGINSSGYIGWNAVPYLTGPAVQAVTKTAGDYTFAYYPRVLASAAGLFPNDGNDANAILTFSKFPGNYYSQLGFNQTGTIYYRNFNGVAINTTQPWSEVVVDYNNPSDGQGDILLRSFGYISGKPLRLDPAFLVGNGDISVYNNAANGNVILTRDTYSNFGISSPGTGTNYVLRIRNVGSASPSLGGFVCTIESRANAQFLQVFRAKVPVGYTINMHNNPYGTYGTQAWLTSNKGTGKWEWYVRKITCGEAGSFSTTGYIAFSGTAGTSSAPVDFYLAYHQVYDLTSQAYSALVSQSIPFNAGATNTSAKISSWATTTGQNKVYDNQSNKKWISGAAYSSSGWPNSDTGDMRFWLYGDSAGQWLNMNLDGYYFSIKGFIGDSSSATVGLSTAPMYAGYFTNLSATKITAGELYGDSIKAALGDYNGVVTYNADTNALSVNTTAAYDAWGKTSDGGIYYPSTVTQPAIKNGTVLLTTTAGSNLLKDASDSDDAGLVIFPNILTPTSVSSIPAGTTTYKLPYPANPMRYYPELYSKLSALFSNIYFRTNAAESLTGQSPTTVSADSGGALSFTFASSLNPSTAATRLRMGVGIGNNIAGGVVIGTGVYNNGQASLLIGMCGYNSGNYACAIGQSVYNDGALGAALFGARLYNNAGRSLVVGVDNKNMQPNSAVLGEGHDTTNGSSCVAVVGKYSLVTSTTAFAVGGGTSVSARSNLFEVSTAGVVTSSRTTTSSLGTNSVPWHHVHTTGLTIYEAGEVGLPFEGDGFLKYDNDNGLYLDTAVYLPKAGGTVTGVLTFGASSADNRKLVPSANATGYVGTSSVRWGAGYFNALYCGSSNTNVASKLSDHESRISALEEGTCLIEGTKILMADNSEKNIEDVGEGDLIMSYDPNTNKLCEAVVIGNYRTGISNDFTNYYFEDGSYLTIFGGHLVYSANQGIARHIKHFEPGWTSITPECKETAFIGSESVDNVGHKRHYNIHSSNKLYFANGILNGQSMTLDYARYRDKDFPEEYLQALKADYDAGYNINKFKTDKEIGATLVPILKELKAQKKVMDDNKKRLADSDYLVAKFTEGLISAAEWLKAKAERAGWRSAVNKAEPLYAAAEERYNAFKAKYKAPNTKREMFNAAVARDNACLDALKAYYKSKNELSK